jgi:hypothetical protein
MEGLVRHRRRERGGQQIGSRQKDRVKFLPGIGTRWREGVNKRTYRLWETWRHSDA